RTTLIALGVIGGWSFLTHASPTVFRTHGVKMSRCTSRTFAFLIFYVLLWPTGRADAQGVTTAAVTGVVTDEQAKVIPGATVTAKHVPSGTVYEAVTNGEGRFFMPGMRVG